MAQILPNHTQTANACQHPASFPAIEVCAIEIARASDCELLSLHGQSLEPFAKGLVKQSIRLMSDSRYQQVTIELGSRAVNMPGSRYFPLTEDLLPRLPVDNIKKAREISTRFDRPGFYKKLTERIAALEIEVEEKNIFQLDKSQQGSLVQLAEFAILFLHKSFVPHRIDELKKLRQLDMLAPAIDLFGQKLASSLPAGLEKLQNQAIIIFSAFSFANLQNARAIGEIDKAALGLESRLSIQDLDSEFARKVSEISKSIYSQESIKTLEETLIEHLSADLLKDLPKEVLSTIVDIAQQSEIAVAKEWLNDNYTALNAMMVSVVLNNDYRKASSVSELQTAVTTGIISTKRAAELIQSKPKTLFPADHRLYVHLMNAAAPRILEALAITGASAVTILGDMSTKSTESSENLASNIKSALTITKSFPALLKTRIPLATFGGAEDIIKAELAGINRKCDSQYINESIPAVLSAIEKRSAGPIAWVLDASGAIERVFVFDSEIGPKDTEWECKRLAPGIIMATPRNRIQINVSKITCESKIETSPIIDASPQPQTDPNNAQSPKALNKSAPTPQSPTHTLSSQLKAELSAWLERADKDQTFQCTLEKHEDVLRKAARGKALNSKAFRDLLGLEKSLRDKNRRPAFSNLNIHNHLDSLAEIIKSISSEG